MAAGYNVAWMTDTSIPDNFDDTPPLQATGIEQSRAAALAVLASYDYQPLIPPLVEYLQTLTAGDDYLDLQTFKFTDTLSGRTLGIRADQTPQVARYDRALGQTGVRRYCYCGPVVCTRPAQQWYSRERMQLGAELFGADSPNGDWEIIRVAMDVLCAVGAVGLRLDIGCAGLFLSLTESVGASVHKTLTEYVRQRNVGAIQSLVADGAITKPLADKLSAFAKTDGEGAALDEFADVISGEPAATFLGDMRYVACQLAAEGIDVNINLSELGSYGYHTGIVFTIDDGRQVIARGGRYPEGVGFSTDLRLISPLPPNTPPAVCVPLVGDDASWRSAVKKLRADKRRLRFVHQSDNISPPCLRQQNGTWSVQEE